MKKDTWNTCVELAKQLISHKRRSQMRVAELAIEACEITWGGPKTDGKTLKEFAKEVGVNHKTLSSWVCTKRNVYDKLSSDLKAKASMSDLVVAARLSAHDASAKEVNKIMGGLVYESRPDTRILKYIQTLRSIYVNMNRETTVMLCKKETLEEVKFFCEGIIQGIDKNSETPILPKEHNLASVYSAASSAGVGAAMGATPSSCWRMNKNDKTVLNFIKNSKNAIGPTAIGPQLSKNGNAGKLRALRSLNKLVSMGQVFKDEKGKYLYRERTL